jgi:hypothetical protein
MKINPLSYSPRIAVGALLGAFLTLGSGAAQAGLLYTGGIGETVYGVAPYCCGAQGTPKFIGDNVTGFNDVMASPGGAFQLANPVSTNNIFQTPLVNPLPLFSFQNGGGNAFGAFGSGATNLVGPNFAFRLSDSAPGGGSLSYSISTMTSNFTITAGGYRGNLGTYLAIGGTLFGVNDSAAASLVSQYYLNGVYQGSVVNILADAGNGNFVDLGGTGAALFQNGLSFQGLAISNVLANLSAGSNVKVVSTLTAFADPAMIDSIFPDEQLIDATGTVLPGDLAGTLPVSAVPLPPALLMFGSALAGLVGFGVRKKLRVKAA